VACATIRRSRVQRTGVPRPTRETDEATPVALLTESDCTGFTSSTGARSRTRGRSRGTGRATASGRVAGPRLPVGPERPVTAVRTRRARPRRSRLGRDSRVVSRTRRGTRRARGRSARACVTRFHRACAQSRMHVMDRAVTVLGDPGSTLPAADAGRRSPNRTLDRLAPGDGLAVAAPTVDGSATTRQDERRGPVLSSDGCSSRDPSPEPRTSAWSAANDGLSLQRRGGLEQSANVALGGRRPHRSITTRRESTAQPPFGNPG